MAKRLRVTKPKLLSHHYVDIGIQFCANVLIVAFLICVILYNSKILQAAETTVVVDTNNNEEAQSLENYYKTMRKFINIMSWILLFVIGVSAFISFI